jgi:hypothetical protein
MAHFRIEAVLDAASNLYALEAYFPAEATVPFARTKPRFQTEQEVFDYFKEKFSEKFHDKEPAKDLKPN